MIYVKFSAIKIYLFRTDFIWAKAMGFTGPQMADSDGVDVGKLNLKLYFSFYFNIIRNGFQANAGIQISVWEMSSLQAYW